MGGRDAAAELRRLAWQCRRGMLELDSLLLGFLEQGYPSLDDPQRRLFVQLLEAPDPRLLDWLMARDEPSDPRLRALVGRIREVAFGGHAAGPAAGPVPDEPVPNPPVGDEPAPAGPVEGPPGPGLRGPGALD